TPHGHEPIAAATACSPSLSQRKASGLEGGFGDDEAVGGFVGGPACGPGLAGFPLRFGGPLGGGFGALGPAAGAGGSHVSFGVAAAQVPAGGLHRFERFLTGLRLLRWPLCSRERLAFSVSRGLGRRLRLGRRTGRRREGPGTRAEEREPGRLELLDEDPPGQRVAGVVVDGAGPERGDDLLLLGGGRQAAGSPQGFG